MTTQSPRLTGLSSLTLAASLASLAALASACGSQGGIESAASSPSPGADDGDGDGGEADATGSEALLLAPPKEFYDALAARLLRLGQSKDYEVNGVDTAAPTIRIIFGGGMVTRGYGPGQSSLICGDAATIGESALSEADRAQLVAAVEAAVSDTGVKVELEGDATSGGSTIFVGGAYADLGCGESPGDKVVTAIAPVDAGNLIDDDVGFVFDATSADGTAALIATLEKAVTAIADPKNSAATLAARAPLDEAELSGLAALADMGDVLWGVKDTGINLTALRGELDRLIPGGSQDIAGIERLIAATVGAVQSTQPQTGSTAPATGGPAAQVGAAVGAVDPATVATVATMAGHPEIALAVMVLGPLIGMGNTTPPATTPTPTTGTVAGTGGTGGTGAAPAVGTQPQVTLPDYAAYLSLPKFASRAAWEGAFLGHIRYINQHYVGDTQQSLQALAIMAYAKALQGL
jgi:hypothetical protein